MAICVEGAQRLHTQAVNICSEVQDVLQRTNGVVSWHMIAQRAAGGRDREQPANKDTIRKYVTETDGFWYTVTQTMPQCPVHSRRRRLHWAIRFHLLWEGAKLMWMRAQILFVHIDEK